MQKTSSRVAAVAAMTVASLFGATAQAVNFQWTGGGDGTSWESDANWDVGGGLIPGAGAGDNASLSGVYNEDKTFLISSVPANAITGITIGETGDGFVSMLQGNVSLTVGTIISNGTLGAATNIIDTNLTQGSTNTIIGASTNDLTIGLTVGGRTITNTGGTTSAPFTIVNNSGGRTVTINSNITLNNTTVSGAALRFQNDATAGSTIVLNGIISNGSANGAVKYNRGTFIINGANTYSGGTTLNENSPNAVSVLKLGHDQAFGTGSVSFSGGTATQFLEAYNGGRTIANNIVLGRNPGFQGSNNLTLTGEFRASGSTTITNNMATGVVATLAGNIFTDTAGAAATSQRGRVMTFTGSGTTLITGVVDDVSGIGSDETGNITNSGTGSVIITSASTYHNGTHITGAGSVQLGNGGTTGSADNARVVSGGSTGTGQFIINRSDSLNLQQSLNGGIGLSVVGAGTVTITSTNTNYNTGTNNVGAQVGSPASVLLVNSGSLASTVQDGLVSANTALGVINVKTISNLASTTNLRVGQTVYLSSGAASAATYIKSIDSATQVTVYGTSLLTPSNQTVNLTFGAGAGLSGASTLVWKNATLGGNGVIAGSINALAGSIVTAGTGVSGDVESLDVGGNVTLSGVSGANPASTLKVEFDATGDGSIDRLNIAGTFTVNGATLDITNLGGLPDDEAYVFATYGALAGTGFATYVGVPDGYTVDTNYLGLNQMAVRVPEPASLGLIGLLGSGLLARRRRKA